QQLTGACAFCYVIKSVVVTCTYLDIVEVKSDSAYESIIPIFEAVAVQLGKTITEVAVRIYVGAYQVCPVRSGVNFYRVTYLEDSEHRDVDVMQIELGFMVYDPKVRRDFVPLG